MGRRKMEMKKIANQSSRFVTFSKRRSGLFKKAGVIASLSAAQVAIIVFSPTGKPFSFGESSADAVTNRFLNEDDRSAAGKRGGNSSQAEEVKALRQQLERLNKQVKTEKEKQQRMKAALPAATDIEELGARELQIVKDMMEKIREAASRRMCEIESEASNSLLFLSCINS